MTTRNYQLVIGTVLAASMVFLVTGCGRESPTVVAATDPASATVGNEIDDTVVTTKVKSALLADDDIKSFDIQVETRKGVVQLSGFVDSQTQIDRAVAVAASVEGVKGTESRMSVKEGKVSVGNQVDDSIVTTRVKSALLAESGIKSGDIAVATSNGEVQLSGFVDSQAQIERATAVARGVEGAQGVVNEMSIKK